MEVKVSKEQQNMVRDRMCIISESKKRNTKIFTTPRICLISRLGDDKIVNYEEYFEIPLFPEFERMEKESRINFTFWLTVISQFSSNFKKGNYIEYRLSNKLALEMLCLNIYLQSNYRIESISIGNREGIKMY